MKIYKMDLRKSDKDLAKESKVMGLDFESMKRNRKKFDIIFYIGNTKGEYDILAFVRKNETKIISNFEDCVGTLSSMSSNIDNLSNDGAIFEVPLNESASLDIDTILDKISISGINSLTEEEKDFLDKQR
jgi:hypothetical protein